MSDHPLPNSSSGSADWEAIARYLEGTGAPQERRAVEQDLSAHPERARLLAELGRAIHAPAPAAPTAGEVELALTSVLAKARTETVRPPQRNVVSMDAYRRRRIATVWRAAAAVLVVAGAGLLWQSTLASRSQKGAQAARQFASAVGAIDSVTLSDGTRVLLGPGSSLTLAAGFGGASRELTLVGEARFNVHHDEKRPFIVRTSAATFRDVGTVFSIHSDSTEGARIVVSEGAVAVQGGKADAAVTLHKGDRGSIAAGGTLAVDRASLSPEDTAWTAGRLLFRDASVAQVIADVKRWYGLDVRVDPSLASHHVSAEFDGTSAPDVGRVLAALLGGGFRQDGTTISIVPPPASAPK